jgi:Tfp pilus assembly protein PilX
MKSGAKEITTITADGTITEKEYAVGNRKAHAVKKAQCTEEAYRNLCTRIIDCIACADRLNGYCDDASEELTIYHQYGRVQKMDRGLGSENCNIGDVVNTFLLEYFQSSPC